MEKRDKESVLKTAKDQRVKFIRLWFTDILGFLKSFAITHEQLKTALEEGMGFDGSSIQGFARIDESDLVRETLGDHLFAKLITDKKVEWKRYASQVTDWELEEYLPVL